MDVYSVDRFRFELPEGHPFPAERYLALREQVEAELGARLRIRVPRSATVRELCAAHDPHYVCRVLRGRLSALEQRRIGFPWSPSLVERARRSAGATLGAARSALVDGVACSLSGGTHHAFRDRGEGFCLFNDAVIVARILLRDGLARRVLVVDADVHQGNGTAAMARGDDAIFAFSIHARNNYPRIKEPGDLDVELADGTGDAEYLDAFGRALEQAFVSSRADFVVYLAGADPLRSDRLGRLSLTLDGLGARDRLVFEQCRRRSVPVAVLMAGGYARPIEDSVAANLQTVSLALANAGGDQRLAGRGSGIEPDHRSTRSG